MADVHLDTAFRNRDPEMRHFLRDTVRSSFKAGIDLAISNDCDALLIAGDFFDNETLSFATEKFIFNEINRLNEADIKVYYATGNHDPSGVAYRAANMKWPSNVYIFGRSQPEAVPLTDSKGNTKAIIVGAGHEGTRESENLARLFPNIEYDDIPYIGLLHALVTGSSGDTEHERYAPCVLEDLESKGYKYWALGHIHTRGILSRDPYIIYPGNLTGRNPRETGTKGAYLVEIDDNETTVDFYPLSPICWVNMTEGNLGEAGDFDSLHRILAESIKVKLERENLPGDILLRLNIEGPCHLYKELKEEENIETLVEELVLDLNLRYLEIKADNIIPPLDPDKYRGEPHILGTLLSMLDIATDDEEILLGLSPERLAGFYKKDDEKGKVNYLQSLLKGLDYEAVARMVEVDDL